MEKNELYVELKHKFAFKAFLDLHFTIFPKSLKRTRLFLFYNFNMSQSLNIKTIFETHKFQ